MKTKTNKSKAVLIALMTMFTLWTVTPAMAVENRIDTPVNAELKYIGNLKNNPVFQLDLNNTEKEIFIVTIKDSKGVVLYAEKLKGENITRKYRFLMDEIEEGNIRFEVLAVNTNTKEVYEVDTYVRTSQDVVINKVH